MEKINLTCVTCPIGCQITVTRNGDEITSIVGNTCKRGEAYARNEVICPKRVITSTVRDTQGNLISVKSSAPIEKKLMLEAMKLINAAVINGQTAIGDVIIDNILDSGTNIVATKATPQK